uniref:Microtubule-actin cross-linking factor 1 n=1 Tax=Phallusia mammillata TaxID=59560 RepID=A0A6F9DKZ7_9ASCI|nr:microtubule-actin cross-linking factor 1 [Phallusia mammillata]
MKQKDSSSGNLADLLEMQKDLKVFRKNSLVPARKQTNAVNSMGYELIYSAHQSVRTNHITDRLKAIDIVWQQLNQLVGNYDSSVQRSMIKCGQFQDVYQSYITWLKNVELMIAQQQAPSWEYSVVAVQLEEHKALQEILQNEQVVLLSLIGQFQDVESNLSEQDNKNLEMLKLRWDGVWKKITERSEKLTEIVLEARIFNGLTNRFKKWLQKVEKQASDIVFSGNLHDRIEKEISHQQALARDINHHETEICEIEGTPLKEMLCDNDINLQSLENFIENLRNKYSEISSFVTGRKNTLENNKKLSHLFNDRLLNLFAFVSESNMHLSKWEDEKGNVHVLDAKPMFIKHAIESCQIVLVDVSSKNSMLSKAITEGRELLSKCAGDDNLIAHAKLDSLSVEFNSIIARAKRIIEKLDGMYEVSTEMQEKHQLFIDWLKTSNEKFLDMETGDVTSIDELKNTLKEFDPNLHKPTLNFIKIASEKLSLISVWWGTQLLNKLHMHCETQFITVNKRFALHCDCLEALTNEIKEFNDHLDVCQLQLGNVNECINNVESLSSFKQDNLFSKQDTEQKMKDLISEVGCQSVKLEQDLHKLRCKLATSDFNIINAQMEGYREQLKDTMEKYSFCTKHASLAISLGCKWHQSSSVLTAWMIDAKSSLKLIQEEKFAQMETHKQKLQSLFNRHADMGLHVASMTKCAKEIEKLLGNNTAVQEIILNSEQKKLEYENLSEMLSNIIDSTNNTCSLMKTIQQQIETSFTSLSSMMDDLHQLAPISIDKESILRRKQKFELSQTADCMLEVSVIEENVNQLFALLSNIGYDHLKEGILVKFNSLQDLKTDLASLIALELNKLEKLLSNLQQFSNFLENTNQKIDDLYQNVTDITVQQVVNPDVMSQQTHKLEALTEEILVVVDQHNKLQMLGDECKSIQLLSGHETSFIDRETEEVSMKLQKLQAVFDKVKFKFNEALEYAIHFYKTSTELKQFFLNQCGTIDKLIPANDLEMIKNQMEILKDIRASSAPHQVEAKKLCTHAFELMSHTTADIDIQNEDVLKLQNASSLLDEKLLQAQVALDKALIEVGELKHAIEEMLQWQEQIFGELTSQKQRLDPCSHDSKKLDHELTKLELMRQDVIAHHSSYNSIISKFGNIMNSSIEGESTDALSDDVEELKQTWQNINLLIAELQQALDKSLESAQMKEAELLEIDFWIDETLANLSGTNFFGGLPESAQQQLDTHMELMKELQNKKNALENLVMDENREVDDIVKKMNHLSSVAEVREEKLKEALEEAKAFHKRLQNFTSWLGKAEKTLEVFLETNHTWLFPDLIEIDTEQKKFEAEVTGMRPEILALDKTGSHLKYFSQKQDGILIKNLLLSVHSRWDKLLSGTSSRSISLSDIHKKSKQFHDNYDKLLDWMQQAIKQLGENKSNLYVDAPDLVETELQKFKEFQRALSEKQPVYDGVTRAGVILSEKVTLQSDLQTIESKLKHLKQEWNALNETSVQRKNQLEESLLFSGRFTEAIDSLLQWLCKIEPEVNTQAQLQGDIHTVTALLDRHNILYNEFNARHANVDSLQQSVSRGQGDSWVTHQLQELLERWNTVSDKIALKQECLEDALCKAKKLHSSGQLLLEDLSAVEKYLNSQQRFPADEFQLQELKASFHTLSQELLNKENDKNHVISLATAILEEAHPDAHTPIRQLMTVVQTKWEEIKQKSDDYGLNLNKTIAKLKQDTMKMKNLESWLTSAEETLSAKESLHITAENVERLKQELDAFQEDMLAHQSDYEMLMNLYSKRKSGQPKRKEGIKSPRDYDESPMESMFANTHSLWQKVWLKALDHERKLQEAKEAIRRSNQQHEFDFDNWRKRYMKWMKHKRARVMDFFRELDKDGSGQITRQQFIQEILNSKFHTDEAEMTKVADVFDKDGDGYIDYYEFIAALYPSRDTYKTESDADKIDDEVIRQVAKCTCCKKFKVEQIAENKYKFGDNQQLRLVRILRSTVMVRVGGGWMALDEFLIKNDPCRAKGRTNTELREKFILPSGASQAMTPFKTKRSSRSPQKQAHPSPSSSTQNLATTSTTPSKQTSPASAGTSHVKAQRETPKRTSKIPTKDKTPKR